MGNEAKREYIALLIQRYHRVSKGEKGKILHELVRNLGIHRKSAIRLMRRTSSNLSKRGRKKIYGSVITDHLRILWRVMDYICAKKMVAAMQDWLPHYLCSAEIKEGLSRISAATVDRLLASHKSKHRRQRNTGTVPSHMKTIIPIRPLGQKFREPGWMEGDTVAHCGDSMSGQFVWSLTATDIHSGWTENAAVWNKQAMGIKEVMINIDKELPFDLLGFFSDNGSEFINEIMLEYFLRKKNKNPSFRFERGRPYRKNDQAHVEQKNYTHVRSLFGYNRIDDKMAMTLMNDLYRNEWRLYQNFFIPQVRLVEKERFGARYRRRYDKPQTPYRRLCASDHVSERQKLELVHKFSSLNPFALKKVIDEKLGHIYRLITRKAENSMPAG